MIHDSWKWYYNNAYIFWDLKFNNNNILYIIKWSAYIYLYIVNPLWIILFILFNHNLNVYLPIFIFLRLHFKHFTMWLLICAYNYNKRRIIDAKSVNVAHVDRFTCYCEWIGHSYNLCLSLTLISRQVSLSQMWVANRIMSWIKQCNMRASE